MLQSRRFTVSFSAILFLLAVAFGAAVGLTGSPVLDNAAVAQAGGKVPGSALGNTSDSELWRAVRRGAQGSVSTPDKQAGVLIQSDGDSWRAFRNGPMSQWGGWGLLGIIAFLALFFATRGRIRIEAGPSGRTVERFNGIERFAHWLTAITFLAHAITGLNLLYGRYVIKPILGDSVFATLSLWGKMAHNYLAFPLILGLVMIFVLWVRDNIPNRQDAAWLSQGGGMFTTGVHPSSKKFNAGQKIIFWVVVLGGLSLSLSGLSLMFPYEIKMFAATNAFINIFGANLPTELTALQEMQLAQMWHGVVALVMIVIIIAHIYIGSLGMEGAFDAMGTGMVDENWAREHHDLWVAEIEGEPAEGDD